MVKSYRDFSITISNRFTFIVIASISSPSIFDISIARLKIYIYFNTTMARVCRKLHFRNKDLEGLLRQPRGIIRTSRVLSAEFSIDVAN